MKFALFLMIFSSIISTIFSSQAHAEGLEIGSKAPSLEVTIQNGKNIHLEEAYQQGFVLIYFYPKADTPGCTKQACSLRDAYEELQEKGIQIFGVSTDSALAQKKFKDKYRLPFSLIADENKSLIEAFQVPTRLSFARRQAFLIKEGKLVWKDLSASTSKQAEDVLKVIEGWEQPLN